MTDQTPDVDPARLVIRVASDDDAAAIANLLDAGRLGSEPAPTLPDQAISRLGPDASDETGHSGFWLGELDGLAVGIVGVHQTSRHRVEVRGLRVHPEYRRVGIGTRLMEHAILYCQRQGFLKVALDVRTEREPAIKLFEKCGFQLAGTRNGESSTHEVLDFYLDLYREPGI
ncbi:MAG: GNAT family N-acetyltransferase [Phycisphaerales bacterium]|nr:GNAT family N-acetyltransferase [Phycisphaerales bacterium]